MALCSRSCLAVFLVVCLATPLFASPLFFNIFQKNGTRASRTTTASPNNFDIDFSISSNDDADQPNFFQRVRSTARLVSAFLKSFFTVITNRNNNEGNRNLELTTDDPFADFDPFGVEPSESDIDFFATLDNPSDATSSGRSLDSNSEASSSPTGDPIPELKEETEVAEPSGQDTDPKPDGEKAVMSDQNERMAEDSGDTGSSSPNADSNLISADIRKAILLGSARLV